MEYCGRTSLTYVDIAVNALSSWGVTGLQCVAESMRVQLLSPSWLRHLSVCLETLTVWCRS